MNSLSDAQAISEAGEAASQVFVLKLLCSLLKEICRSSVNNSVVFNRFIEHFYLLPGNYVFKIRRKFL